MTKILRLAHDVLTDDLRREIPDDSVDLIFTSPPYFERDGYSIDLMIALGRLAERVLKPGGRCFVNFGQVGEDYLRPYEIVATLSRDLTTLQTIMWAKSMAVGEVTYGHFQPINSPTILNYCFEFLFQFSKGRPTPLDRLAVGVPYMDKANLTRGTRGKNGDKHCAGDIWFVPYETTGHTEKKPHRHAFPRALAERALKLVALPAGGAVLDPFAGSGTVGQAAEALGLDVTCWLNDRTYGGASC